mmetsp:Transcript_67310/g.186510  ORF Transcript_67310/g.186510 Transcript_67310/m.186510 type:complete len:218 (+) Transcript_67310:40-693(+)
MPISTDGVQVLAIFVLAQRTAELALSLLLFLFCRALFGCLDLLSGLSARCCGRWPARAFRAGVPCTTCGGDGSRLHSSAQPLVSLSSLLLLGQWALCRAGRRRRCSRWPCHGRLQPHAHLGVDPARGVADVRCALRQIPEDVQGLSLREGRECLEGPGKADGLCEPATRVQLPQLLRDRACGGLLLGLRDYPGCRVLDLKHLVFQLFQDLQGGRLGE